MARKDSKPCRDKHPGVSHSHRERYGYVADYRDALTGKRTSTSLAHLGITRHDDACRWCVDLSNNLRERASELARSGGRTIFRSLKLSAAIDRYEAHLRTRTDEPRERTFATYRRDIERFAEWCKGQGIADVLHIGARHLHRFSDEVAKEPKRRPARGARRGARATAPEHISTVTANRIRTSVRAFLNWARKAKHVALTRDEIGEALAHAKVTQATPSVLSPAEIVALLDAAIAHDGQCYALTRSEKGAGVDAGAGETPKFAPVAPYLLLTLLCGLRRSEGLRLRWRDVSLDGVDGFGNPAPYLQLEGTATKTRRVRRIPLDVCPTVATLLARLRQERGGRGYVFGTAKAPMSDDALKAGLKRLAAMDGVPATGPQELRRTGESYAASAPGLGLTPFALAARYGHSIATAEKFYLHPVVGIPADARTLESVMGVEGVAQRIAGAPRVARVVGLDAARTAEAR